MVNKSIDKILTNLCIVLLVSSQYLAMVLGCYSPGKTGFFTIVLAVLIVLFIARLMVNPIRWVSKKFFIFAFLILASYGLTLMFCSEKTNLTVIDFIGMCFIPFLFGGILDFDGKTVIRWTMYTIIFAIPVFQQVFVKANAGTAYDAVSMGSSYALVPVIGASIVHFMLFRKESTFFDKIVYIANIFFLFSFVQMSYRGPLVCLAVLVLFCAIYNISKEGKTNKNIILISALLILVVLLLIYLDEILIFVYDFLAKRNIRIAFLDKTRFLVSAGEGDLVHGRTTIWKTALEGFFESPIFGHGLATFLYNTGIVFPHNFILQFLYDGGLLLTIPLMSVIIAGIRKSIRDRKIDSSRFSFVVFAGGIAFTRGLVSAETWRIILLWLLFGYFTNNYGKSENICEEHEFEE